MMSRRLDRSDPLAEIGALLGELYTPEEIVGWLFGQHSAFGKPAAALISEGRAEIVLEYLRGLSARVASAGP